MPGIDPSPFTAWGVLGLLGLAFLILTALLYKLIGNQTASQQARDGILMQFFNENRKDFANQAQNIATENRTSMQKIADTVVAGQDRLVLAFEKQARALDKVLLINSFMEHVERLKKSGVELTYEEMRKAFDTVAQGDR